MIQMMSDFCHQLPKLSIDEVFIGSCMTNIGHFRAAAQLLKDKTELNTVLWVVPPTRMDEKQLRAEGIYETFERLNRSN